MRTALVFGANAQLGLQLVHRFAQSEEYSQVHIVTDRKLNLDHPKISQHIIDFYLLDKLNFRERIDDVYVSAGEMMTSLRDSAVKMFNELDLNYSVGLLCKRIGAKSLNLVSASGADSKAKNPLLKLRGEIEESLKKLPISRINIYRPAFNLPSTAEMMNKVKSSTEASLDVVKKKANDLANAMLTVTRLSREGTSTFSEDKIDEMSKSFFKVL